MLENNIDPNADGPEETEPVVPEKSPEDDLGLDEEGADKV